MVLLLLTAILSMYITYKPVEFWIVTGIAMGMCVLGGAFAATVAGRNRFLMWARYDSPKGIEHELREQERARSERQQQAQKACKGED